MTMTPAQVRQMQQQAAREAKEQLKAQQRAEREAAAEAKRQQRAQQEAEKARQREINSAIRAGEHVATSRLGQDVIRGVFGTLFGGKK